MKTNLGDRLDKVATMPQPPSLLFRFVSLAKVEEITKRVRWPGKVAVEADGHASAFPPFGVNEWPTQKPKRQHSTFGSHQPVNNEIISIVIRFKLETQVHLKANPSVTESSNGKHYETTRHLSPTASDHVLDISFFLPRRPNEWLHIVDIPWLSTKCFWPSKGQLNKVRPLIAPAADGRGRREADAHAEEVCRCETTKCFSSEKRNLGLLRWTLEIDHKVLRGTTPTDTHHKVLLLHADSLHIVHRNERSESTV